MLSCSASIFFEEKSCPQVLISLHMSKWLVQLLNTAQGQRGYATLRNMVTRLSATFQPLSYKILAFNPSLKVQVTIKRQLLSMEINSAFIFFSFLFLGLVILTLKGKRGDKNYRNKQGSQE